MKSKKNEEYEIITTIVAVNKFPKHYPDFPYEEWKKRHPYFNKIIEFIFTEYIPVELKVDKKTKKVKEVKYF